MAILSPVPFTKPHDLHGGFVKLNVAEYKAKL